MACPCGEMVELMANSGGEGLLRITTYRHLSGALAPEASDVYIPVSHVAVTGFVDQDLRQHIDQQRELFLEAWWDMHASCRELIDDKTPTADAHT